MFRYTTITRLRQEGFTETELPAPDALLLIAEASGYLSDALGQWFTPVRSQKILDGMGSALLYLPNRVPILEVLSLAQISTASASRPFLVPDKVDILLASGPNDMAVFDSSDYQVYGRYLELLYSEFFGGRGNVLFDCYSGWMDTFSARSGTTRRILTDTTTLISNGGIDAILTSISGFQARDVVLFEKNDSGREVLGQVIVNSIDVGNKKLVFDAIETKDAQQLPVGTRVLTFGAIPRLIERATLLLVKRLNIRINTDDYDDAVMAGKIKSEKTDRYSYTLFGDADGGGVGLTGDYFVDRQLSYYAEPQIHVDFA